MDDDISQTRRALVSGAAIGLVAAPAILAGSSRSNAAAGSGTPAGCAPAVSLRDFGARGDGSDQTAAFNAARDAISARGSDTLSIPQGQYRLAALLNNRFVHLQGAGNAASILRTTTSSGAILRAVHASGSWDGTRLADVGFEGTGRRQGSGFVAGNERLTRLIEYTGRFLFERVRFANFARCIERPYGNIGFDLIDCVFGDADFHVWSRGQAVSSPDNNPMHPGCLTMQRGSMRGAQKASIYIDGLNVVGAGQVVIDSVRFEANPGWLFYIKDFNDRGAQPGILVRSCWNENNGTASSVEIDGKADKPGFAKLSNVPAITFEDTPIGPLVLENSNVTTRVCSLDLLTSLVMDRSSSLTHHEAKMYSGTARGRVASIGALENTDAAKSLNTPWFPMAPPAAPRVRDRTVLVASNGAGAETWGGSGATSAPVEGVALPWSRQVQRIRVGAGAKLAAPAQFVIPAATWLVVQFLARLVSGPAPQVHINGSAGFGGTATINGSEWQTYTAVVQNTGAAISSQSFYLYGSPNGAADIEFGGYAVTTFPSSQSALDFANGRLFPQA